ncbi:hypothetical protein AAC387_Pa03g1876 [Persea americana]
MTTRNDATQRDFNYLTVKPTSPQVIFLVPSSILQKSRLTVIDQTQLQLRQTELRERLESKSPIDFGAAILGALWVLRKREGPGKREDEPKYESLLASGGNGNELLQVTRSGHVRSFQLWMTCWRGVRPEWLLVTRLASACIMAGFLAWDICRYDATIFIYYTEWTFTLTIIYFVLGSLISIQGCRICSSLPVTNEAGNVSGEADLEGSKSASDTLTTNKVIAAIKLQSCLAQEEVEQNARFWGYLLQTVYQTCAGAVMLTDIVFWCLIVPFLSIQHFSLNLLMGCMHSLNAVFLLLDTALNSMPFPWFRMGYFVLWSCIYVIFQWVLHACGYSLWPYPFLELSTPWAPLWYLCLSVVHVPCYGIYALVVKAKNSIFPKLFPNAYISSY